MDLLIKINFANSTQILDISWDNEIIVFQA